MDTAGDALTCCALAASGEAMAFGGSGGYIHLWSDASSVPRVNVQSSPLEPLPAYPAALPTFSLGENDSLAQVKKCGRLCGLERV